jgi:hypothetical protein
MASIFQPGAETKTTTGQPSAASAAMKLFIIQLLMSRLQQTGGAPQTFGDYVQGGPRKFDTSQIAGGLPALLGALKQPGAFNSSTVEKGRPASPSTFQDLSGLLGLGLAGYQAYKGGGAANSSDILQKAMVLKALGYDPKEFGITPESLGLKQTASAMPTFDASYTPQASDLFTNDLFTSAINSSGGNAMDFGASDPSLWESSY